MEKNLILRDREFSRVLEEKVLPFVRRPGRYTGGEVNCLPVPEAQIRVLLSYPDLYEVGMSNHGLKLLYEAVNRLDFARAERAFAWWDDMARASTAANIPLYSLESFSPASDFDFWGFSLSAELTYTNILAMLSAGKLALPASDRPWPGTPLVLGGGCGAYNPEPLADFFDLFLIGDADESLPDLLVAYKELSHKCQDKEDLLEKLQSRIPGLYAPALYRPYYDDLGKFSRLEKRSDHSAPFIPKRVLTDLSCSGVFCPLVPGCEVVHDRAVVEVMRGCGRGCRFCQAGWAGRPVRWKPVDAVVSEAIDQLENSGWDEVSLLSLSSGDYPKIGQVFSGLADVAQNNRVNISMPSLNVASVDDKLLQGMSRIRKSGITLAPEAATHRLQEVINKKLDEDMILEAILEARRQGWKKIKLYYMVGLPTETDEDVIAIANQLHRLSKAAGGLNVTISNFVPKPQTPFQWSSQLGPDELRRRHNLLRDRVKNRKIKLKFRDPHMSTIEGIITRGDRRVSALIEQAWKLGCGFDDWQECFQAQKWQQAFSMLNLNPDEILAGPGGLDAPVPWGHIGGGVLTEVLKNQAVKAGIDKR